MSSREDSILAWLAGDGPFPGTSDEEVAYTPEKRQQAIDAIKQQHAVDEAKRQAERAAAGIILRTREQERDRAERLRHKHLAIVEARKHADRRETALRLRLGGQTWTQIGRALGTTAEKARRLCGEAALEELGLLQSR